MPLNGSGVASKPAGTTAVASTVIESSKFNSVIDDIYSILNTAAKFADGTVAAPNAFASDPDTGFYLAGSNNFAIALGGVKHADFATTGAGLLLKGAPTAGGTADALTVTWPVVASALASEQQIIFKAASTNTGAATLNLNGLGAKAIRKIAGGSDVALIAGDIEAGRRYIAIYDSAANAAAGAWILLQANDDAKGAAITSAATITVTQHYHHITGSTGPITDIDFTDAVDGRWAWLIFDSTPTLTHNATTLLLPGGANITAAAGDRALFVQDATDNVICLAYVAATTVVRGATAADQETATSTTTAVTPSVQQRHPSALKAWLKANIAGSIEGSYNVSGITDTGTGIIDVAWNTDFSSGVYSVWGAGYADATGTAGGTLVTMINSTNFAAGTTRFTCVNLSTFLATDPIGWLIGAAGDQ